MINTNVDPKLIWAFHQTDRISVGLVKEVTDFAWKRIKKVPIFQIPREVEKSSFEYILMDGNHRRNVAEHLEHLLPCALYTIGETIDLVRDNLAYFRHYSDPKIYDKLLLAFQKRE